MIRVRDPYGREAAVDDATWSGDFLLAERGASLEPVGGVSSAYPDPDYARALLLAEDVGGEVLDPPSAAPGPIGRVY